MFQMVIKYTNIYHSKALHNLPKFGIFGLKTNHLATLVPMMLFVFAFYFFSLSSKPCPGNQLGLIAKLQQMFYCVGTRVARFFLVHDTKTGKMYQMNTNCTK
jgi:hypothetical protein